jgi:hypothetical protein
MNSKSSLLLVAGAVGLAAISGVTYGVMQGRSPAPEAPITQQSPIPQSSPVAATPASPVPATKPDSTGVPSKPAAEVTDTSSAEVPDSSPTSETKREIEFCSTSMAQVNDPESPLNVRSSPSTETGEVVGQLRNGTFVTVVDEQNGWFRITTPTKGWISKQRTESGCNQKVERVEFSAGTSAAVISDRFVGTGTHQYLFRVKPGQRMTITRRDGPFPTVTNPDGKVLVVGPEDEDRSTWTDEVTQAGDCTISLDSNYRGYKYSFRVEIR